MWVRTIVGAGMNIKFRAEYFMQQHKQQQTQLEQKMWNYLADKSLMGCSPLQFANLFVKNADFFHNWNRIPTTFRRLVEMVEKTRWICFSSQIRSYQVIYNTRNLESFLIALV